VVFAMMPNMNPKQMAKLMQQMGINTQEIDASRVVIEKTDGGKMIVDAPSVTLIDAKGQKSFQISGEVREEEAGAKDTTAVEGGKPVCEESDADVVALQAKVSKAEAEAALMESGGDIAEAIIALEEKKKR
jgi:nascent polypeptide-associated complex subunit alpha